MHKILDEHAPLRKAVIPASYVIRESWMTTDLAFRKLDILYRKLIGKSKSDTIHSKYLTYSPVFSCYLDASRAFDRVNYWSLFSKLVKRGVPVLIVRLLSYWYNTQLFYVKWADKISCDFKTTNGVRQGGILSPRLFSLYIDELSGRLSTSNVCCFIDGTCMNHFFYADDICLLAPSAISLQELINICATYGEEHDILYNPLK